MTSPPLASDTMAEVARALSGRYTADIAGGAVHLRVDRLPGPAPAAAVVAGGELFLYVDSEKPLAMAHARDLLARHAGELLGLSVDQVTPALSGVCSCPLEFKPDTLSPV